MQENPRENNNFETIISTWRRLSGEIIEYPEYPSMSGDSTSHPFKKKEEDSSLLALERPRGPIATAASAGAVVLSTDDKDKEKEKNPETLPLSDPDEKQEAPESPKDKDENKDAGGDSYYDEKENKSFLDNTSDSNKFSDGKKAKDKGDNVDSVYLRPPPPHKVRSNTTTADDEDCGVKCLYYTLQCCDCVLM